MRNFEKFPELIKKNKILTMKYVMIFVLFFLIMLTACSKKPDVQLCMGEEEDSIFNHKEDAILQNKSNETDKPIDPDKDEQEALSENKSIKTEKEFTTTGLEKDEESIELVMFHNGNGPMCISQLDFLKDYRECNNIIIIEYLTTEEGTREILNEYKAKYNSSVGTSSNFGFLPITFINNTAFSGFDEKIKEKLKTIIIEICNE